MSKKQLFFVIFAIFFYVAKTSAQNTSDTVQNDSILLVKYLDNLSKKQNVFFTYSPNLLSGEKIFLQNYNLETLPKIVEKLENKTGFDFEYLGNRYYVIYPKKETDKDKKVDITSYSPLANIELQQFISGKITDDNNDPLPGASIIVKGSNNGTTTDFNGNYKIVANIGDTLLISYIGFTSKEITINNANFNTSLIPGLKLSEAVVIGSRNPNRTALDTAIPVDIIDIAELAIAGPQISITQILNYTAPSFSSNSQTVSDGTDHIDPAQLRGLGPDQVLVLINGKRRHTSSLVNVNGTPGRGSVGTDLNTIPAAAIKRIEVLRDGASAQYGSDAIAGVINIVLKDITNEFTIYLTSGANFSKNSNNHTAGIDGKKFQVDLNYGLPLGYKGGYINVTGSLTKRQRTSRARDRNDEIFHAYNAIEWGAYNQGYSLTDLKTNVEQIQNYATQVPYFSLTKQQEIGNAVSINELQNILNFDVTDNELKRRDLKRGDFNMSVGQSGLTQGQLMGNLEFPIGKNNVKVYAFGGTSYRRGDAAGFYRTPGHPTGRGNTLAYINGFLPNIESDILDNSFAFGIKGKIKEWDADLSHTFGKNVFKYNISNTSNFYLQSGAPSEFYSGLNGFKQNTVNLDLSRYYNTIFSGLNIALGAEYRIDNYFIEAGEESSYAKYDINGEVETYVSSIDPSLQVVDFFGNQPTAGAQVFSGFTPKNVVDAKRNSFAFYWDIEADITDKFLVNSALRFEDFSDFGNSLNYKIATRLKATNNINIRGAISTGFRAPSLHQQYYNKSNTLFDDDGIAYEVGSFTNNSKIAKLFGIPELKEETSFNSSLGFTAKIPKANLYITIDGYYIKISDRITYTGDFTTFIEPSNQAQESINTIFTDLDIGRAAFFANSINTKTKGVDVVVTHKYKIGKSISIISNFAATFSKTEKNGATKSSPLLESAGLTDVYFSETARIYLERALPRVKMNLANNLNIGKLNFFLRNAYFGSVEDTGILKNNQGIKIWDNQGNPKHPIIGGKIITDLSASYQLSKALDFTIGANNLLDIYPDELPSYLTSSNQFIYSRRVSQFGYSGRFLFARFNFKIR
ncbi:TonB-dependent receptor [Maribacter sp.]|uniref:TonB-dependent receptor n=1 Tax=Maribacter sp. TaxID=1897614 RepID=UPI0025C36D1E|nr:TonB-dependent receptor [Maribacter sp.]